MSLIDRLTARPPDRVIGGVVAPYMNRWRLFNWDGNWPNVYIHRFLRDDDERATHDHPFTFISIVIRGGYYELTHGPDWTLLRKWRGRFSIAYRPARWLHRVELARNEDGTAQEAWTIVLRGRRFRTWGFMCKHGWVHWRKFATGEHGEVVGAGCGAEAEERP